MLYVNNKYSCKKFGKRIYFKKNAGVPSQVTSVCYNTKYKYN